MQIIEYILCTTTNFYYNFFGTTKLFSYEELCLNAWKQSLSEPSRIILAKQLAQVKFVQHQANNLKVCFYYSKKLNYPLFECCDLDTNVAIIFLNSKIQENVFLKANIFIHRGHLFSIEFNKYPKDYSYKYGIDLNTLKIANIKILLSL